MGPGDGSVELLPEGGSARLTTRWLEPPVYERLFQAVRAEADWTQEQVRIAGRRQAVPRLTAWHGDPGISYAYSGIHHRPNRWTPALAEVRGLVEAELGQAFNGVLANCYRDGHDTVAWHADDEAELTGACIASVSLGAARRFSLRRADDHRQRIDVMLGPGSLLVMDATSQRYWRHCVPRTAEDVGPRINLTFRWLAAYGRTSPPSAARRSRPSATS
ncbi:MAG: alpha-ketoglutarate-dependent dioxygenase AlkB [Acidimicrobiales bacterium]|nr:alpha-ketoglutarate-dependent dioxygenase AlkB [Acidimicrobiales bacterium]